MMPPRNPNQPPMPGQMRQMPMQQPSSMMPPVTPTPLPVPNSPNQLPPPQMNPQQMAYRQALTSMAKSPKPLPIAMSTTPEESPVINATDDVSEIVPKTEQDAVQVVEDQDSRDNMTKNPDRMDDPFQTMNYP